jgi:hypothetical protein
MTTELTGAGHYRAAEGLLGQAETAANTRKPHQIAVILAAAQVHATLAQAAAAALPVTVRFVGDSADVTDWAKAVQPDAVVQVQSRGAELPEHWPPKPGDIWQDRAGARWACQPTDGMLARLDGDGDDSPNEINHHHGPLTLVSRVDPSEEECPF